MKIRALAVIVCMLAFWGLGSAPSRAAAWPDGPVDYAIWADLLAKYVKGPWVDYAGFQKEQKRLDEFLKILEKIDVKKLDRGQAMAFYINVYNAWTIRLILTKYPDLESIKDLGNILFSSPWKKEIVRLKEGVLTLDNVEHDILRPKYKDPRVHFAVNCASKGCPPLRAEPFVGSRLDAQLDQMTEAFINDPGRTWLKGDELFVNPIFKWFSEDFDDNPAAFVKKYAKPAFRAALDKVSDLDIEYYDYDWSLNGK